MRALARPGVRAIDIGANFGFYTLTLARGAGPAGRVWAFEPAPSTAAYLRRSATANALANIDVREMAIGGAGGRAKLNLGLWPELNTLTGGLASDHAIEVAVEPLDALWRDGVIGEADFIKIDAEGTENAILAGAATYLGTHSPLVMFEMQLSPAANEALIATFARLGYRTYRHLPALGCLLAHDWTAQNGPALGLGNLFACKPDRAARLAADGLLCDSPDLQFEANGGERLATYLSDLPFAAGIPDADARRAAWAADPATALFRQGLQLFLAARDTGRPLAARWADLEASYAVLTGLCANAPTDSRRISLARAADATGRRTEAISIAQALIDRQTLDLREPFLPLTARCERQSPTVPLGDWFAAMLVEYVETTSRGSSIYSDGGSAYRLDYLHRLGCLTPALERRRQLDRMRRGKQPAAEPNELVNTPGPDNLNAGLWTAAPPAFAVSLIKPLQ